MPVYDRQNNRKQYMKEKDWKTSGIKNKENRYMKHTQWKSGI